MIRLSHVSKSFEGAHTVHAVKDVTLEIQDGEVFGIIGFSGAGKSTLVRCMNLLERPTSGQVFIGDTDITALNAAGLRNARKKIGMIFQHFNLMPSRTVFSNVMFPLDGAKMTRDEKNARVRELLELVGLSDKEKSYPSQLSGGQKQRVAIARALANNPDVLLCDEATSALDPQTTQSILRLLKKLNQELGITIVLITHEMAVVKEVCSRIAVMENGNVVEEGPIYEVFAHPKANITREFIRTTRNLDSVEQVLSEEGGITVKPGDLAVKLDFVEHTAGESVISNVARKCKVDVNIIYGNIEMLSGKPLGTLVVILSGENQNVLDALEYIKSSKVEWEVIKRG